MKLISIFQDQMGAKSACCSSSWTYERVIKILEGERVIWMVPKCDECQKRCNLWMPPELWDAGLYTKLDNFSCIAGGTGV